jgi:hypothetical protein
MKKLNPGPLDSEAVGKIYSQILHESIRIQADHGLGSPRVPKRERARLTEKRRKVAAA